MNAPAAKVTRKQAVLLVTTSLLLCFFALELAARCYSYWLGKGFWSRPHAFESPFFVTYDSPVPYFEGDSAVFRHGVRVPLFKQRDELRVVCLGGSTTVNTRALPEENYTRLAEAALAPSFPGRQVRVLETGGDAFSTAHSLVNFSLRVLAVDPDVATLLHNINDLTAQQFGDRLQPDYANKYLDDAFLAFEHRDGFGGLLMRASRAAQMLRWRSACSARPSKKALTTARSQTPRMAAKSSGATSSPSSPPPAPTAFCRCSSPSRTAAVKAPPSAGNSWFITTSCGRWPTNIPARWSTPRRFCPAGRTFSSTMCT